MFPWILQSLKSFFRPTAKEKPTGDRPGANSSKSSGYYELDKVLTTTSNGDIFDQRRKGRTIISNQDIDQDATNQRLDT